jgi:hypothetical protein
MDSKILLINFCAASMRKVVLYSSFKMKGIIHGFYLSPHNVEFVSIKKPAFICRFEFLKRQLLVPVFSATYGCPYKQGQDGATSSHKNAI